MEQNIVAEVIEAAQWEKLAVELSGRSTEGSKQLTERFARELTGELSGQIVMQIHEWYLEEMGEFFPFEDLQKLKERLVKLDSDGDAGEVH